MTTKEVQRGTSARQSVSVPNGRPAALHWDLGPLAGVWVDAPQIVQIVQVPSNTCSERVGLQHQVLVRLGGCACTSGHTAHWPTSTAAETKRTSKHVDALAAVRTVRSSKLARHPARGRVVRLGEGPLRLCRIEEPGVGQLKNLKCGTTWFDCGRYLVSFGVLIEVTRPSLISANAVKRLGTQFARQVQISGLALAISG